MIILAVVAFSSCGGGNDKNDSDTSAATTTGTMNTENTDTTGVIGSNKIGQGHMRTDSSVQGVNASGK